MARNALSIARSSCSVIPLAVLLEEQLLMRYSCEIDRAVHQTEQMYFAATQQLDKLYARFPVTRLITADADLTPH